MNKDQVISKVNESVASLFTKEDVIKLIECIDVNPSALDELDIDQLKTQISDIIQGLEPAAIADYGSAELSMSGHVVELDHIDIDLDYVDMQVADAIDEFFEDRK